MYYESKSKFYIKQYGPAAIIITVSLLLISIGIFLGLKSVGGKDKAKVDTQVVSKPEKTESSLPAELNSLSPFTRSKEYKVTSITEDSIVVIEVAGKKYEINLIGVKPKKNSSLLQTKMIEDLKGKKVTLEFDSVKEENNKIYGYIYLNNKFYNEQILFDGVGELKTERANINKLDVLLAAEIVARHESKGIWNT